MCAGGVEVSCHATLSLQGRRPDIKDETALIWVQGQGQKHRRRPQKHTGCQTMCRIQTQSVLEAIRGSSVVHNMQWQDRPVLDLEVVQDIKHEPSVPLLSHHKAVKETEPSRPMLMMDLCIKHIYESGLQTPSSGRRWFYHYGLFLSSY